MYMYHAGIVCLVVSTVTTWRMVSGSWDPGSTGVLVKVTNATSAPRLEVLQVSTTAGYIQTPGLGILPLHPKNMDSVVRVDVPENHTAMLSLLFLNLTGSRMRCDRSIVKLSVYETSMANAVWECKLEISKVGLLLRQRISEGARFFVHFKSGEVQKVGFKLYFSVHRESALLPGGSYDVWNCSVPNFADFRLHFPCDMYSQCVDKEDERHCPYFSEECGPGFVTMGKHCFFRETNIPRGTWRDMEFLCESRGGRLANFRSHEEYDRFLRYLEPLLDVWGFYKIIVGLHSASMSLPMMYRQELQHTDKTIAFYRSTEKTSSASSVCGSMTLHLTGRSSLSHLSVTYCMKLMGRFRISVLCEITKRSTAKNMFRTKVQVTPISISGSHLPLVGCPLGHATRDFLACDFSSTCWARGVTSCPAPLTPLPPSFTCANGFEIVPFTLVCDLRHDCIDGSDESFCELPPCVLPEPFYCSNRQCVPRNTVCNGQRNCYNGVDEDLCSQNNKESVLRPSPPAIVQLNLRGQFTVHKMNHTEMVVCPETHFQCPDNGYCLPVFLRCNSVYDCPGWEDEAHCSSYTCSGFYRCRGSQVCLHPEHLCDGIFQCPQNEDELLCDLSCPENCLCYGLAFYCRKPFYARNFTKLRFLDGRGSGMEANDLLENTMLIHLSLAANAMAQVGDLNFPNLRFLDLSDNQLTEIHLHDLRRLPHLETLYLSGNPMRVLFQTLHPHLHHTNTLTSTRVVPNASGTSPATLNFTFRVPANSSGVTDDLSPGLSDGANTMPSLRTLDLSRVQARVLNTSFLSLLPDLHTVNMSGGGVDTMLGKGFQAVTQLRVLDLRGCPLTNFPRDVLGGLDELQVLYSDNYKMCCPATLPPGFVSNNCHAPSDEISSCEALLRSNVYRVFLSIFASLSLLGNSGSFVYRVFAPKKRRLLSFDVFVAHLCVADFLMGFYLSVIGVADRLYQGTYLWEDNTWKKSATCKMAGFVSLVSSEVSALVICLITIDRFLVLRFPFSTFHFGTRAAHVAAIGVWGVGCLLAAFPLAPGVYHWQFYSQTGICIPLPVVRTHSLAYTYAFGVMIVANFVFFLVIAMGQAFIYWSVHTNSLSSGETTKRTQDLTIARRLITVAMSDFLCWFPIGLVGILAANGAPVSSEISVAMIIFVLPFNSALNPFLYTLNIVLEKRRIAAEERIKKTLLVQFRSKEGTENILSKVNPNGQAS